MAAPEKKPENKTVAERNNKVLEFVSALNSDGLDFYAYIIMEKIKKTSFDSAINTPNLNLETWGKVVESGYGERPLQVNHFEIIEAFNAGEYD